VELGTQLTKEFDSGKSYVTIHDVALMVNSENGDGVVSVAVARDVNGVSKGDR
jgi:hypothetical protein